MKEQAILDILSFDEEGVSVEHLFSKLGAEDRKKQTEILECLQTLSEKNKIEEMIQPKGWYRVINPKYMIKVGTVPMTQSSFVESVLSVPKKIHKPIAIGVHNGEFYYGTLLEIDEKILPAIITSGKRLYLGAQIYDEFGLRYRTTFEEPDFPWDNVAIANYLNGKYKKQTTKQIFEKIRKLNLKYMDHHNDIAHDYTSCWIMSTYVFPLFDMAGRLYFHAEKGSGKTKQSRIIHLTAFNSIWGSSVSEASLFRTIEATSGTFIVDNLDFLDDKLKSNITLCMQVGAYSGATYRRVEGDKTKRSMPFNVFSPMAINNIMGLDDVTLDRCFTVNMLRTESDKGKLKIKKSDPVWEEVRNDIRNWALDNWELVDKTKDEIVANLNNRELDVVHPVLTVAKMCGEEIYEKILHYIHLQLEKSKIKDLETDWKYIMLRTILDEIGKNDSKFIRTSDLTNEMLKETHGIDYYDKTDKDHRKKWYMVNRWISKTLNNIPLFSDKRTVQGYLEYNFTRKDVNRVLRLNNYPTDTTQTTITTETTQTTETTKNTLKMVGSVASVGSGKGVVS